MAQAIAKPVPTSENAHARVVTREPAMPSATAWFEECFHQIDREVEFLWNVHDGDRLVLGQVVRGIDRRARSLLTAERSGLNFLQT